MKLRSFVSLAVIGLAVAVLTVSVRAHCDTLDGPVVKAAQKALRTGNANYVLVWVQPGDDPEIRRAFEKTLIVRRLGKDARELADMYFFETAVRLHRAGEGEPYTGLKPVGTKIEPIIAVMDNAIQTGNVSALLAKLPADHRPEVEKGFRRVMDVKKYNANDVAAGREYVKAYVSFIHTVEHIYAETEAS